MSITRSAARSRRLAAAAVSFALTGTLAVTGVVGGGIEETEAAWNDTEVALAQVSARWMEGYTRVTDPGWKMRNVRDSGLPSSIAMNGPFEVTRDFGLTYPQIAGYGLATGTDDNRDSLNNSPTIVPPRTVTDALWMGRYVTGVAGGTDIAHAKHCMSYPQPASMTATTNTCTGNPTSSPRLVAHQDTLGYTSSIHASGGATKTARVNVAGFSSTAQCFSDGSSSASISDTNSILQLANSISTLNYSFDFVESIKNIIPTGDNPLERYDGTTDQWMRYNAQPSAGDPSFVLAANVRKNTFRAPYYALAEMDLIIQVYSAGGASGDNGRFIDQINFPLTRSECGFSNGTQPIPIRAGTWRGDTNQLGWPGKSLGTTVPTNSTRLQQFTFADSGVAPAVAPAQPMALRAAPVTTTTTTSPPPATTMTSPLESTTATATTTSAPLDPTPTATQSTTATSAAPAIVIPDEPGTLSADAQTGKVGTVQVNGTDNDVVVKGDTVPSDALTAPDALDTWINDGARPSGDWTTFTSTDPSSDGWRWAAINQQTGTVVYLR